LDIPVFLGLTRNDNKTEAGKCMDAWEVKAQLSGEKGSPVLHTHFSLIDEEYWFTVLEHG